MLRSAILTVLVLLLFGCASSNPCSMEGKSAEWISRAIVKECRQ